MAPKGFTIRSSWSSSFSITIPLLMIIVCFTSIAFDQVNGDYGNGRYDGLYGGGNSGYGSYGYGNGGSGRQQHMMYPYRVQHNNHNYRNNQNRQNNRYRFRCPQPNGNFRDDSCKRFWHCSFGKATLRKCPDGTRFDARFRTCLPISIAKCYDRISAKSSYYTSGPSTYSTSSTTAKYSTTAKPSPPPTTTTTSTPPPTTTTTTTPTTTASPITITR